MKLNRQRMYFAQHDPTSWPISVSDSLSQGESVDLETEAFFSGVTGFCDFSGFLGISGSPMKFWMMHTLCCFDAGLHNNIRLVGDFEWWRILGKSGLVRSQLYGRSLKFLASSSVTVSALVVFGAATRDETFVRDELTDPVDCWSLDNCSTLMIVSCCDLSFCKFWNRSKKWPSGESEFK